MPILSGPETRTRLVADSICVPVSGSLSLDIRGVGPGRLGDYSPRLPQIPTCGSPASGSSRRGFAVPHTIRRPCGDTALRFNALAVGPVRSPRRGTPLAPRGPGGPVPPLLSYYGVLRLPAIHLAALRFLRLAIPLLRPWFVPSGPGRGTADQPGVGKPVSPAGWVSGNGRVSQVPRGSLVIIRPALRPRRDLAG